MGKKILMIVLGVVVGWLVGSIVMMGCHMATMLVYPPPEGLDVMDPDQVEAFNAWLDTLPAGAFILTSLCHWIGTAAGAAVAMLITGRRAILPALLVGVVFTLGGMANLMRISHPDWYGFVDLPGYLLVAWLVGKWLLRAPAAAESAT